LGLLRHEETTVAEMRRLFYLPGISVACSSIKHFKFPELKQSNENQLFKDRKTRNPKEINEATLSSQAKLERVYPTPIRYWSAKKNFGYLLGPEVVTGLTGLATMKEASDVLGPYLLTVGSIIQTIDRPGAVIWGSGLLRPIERGWKKRLLSNPITRIAAVRGKLTRSELIEKLDLYVPEVFGDPALLLPKFITFPKCANGLVVCPHLNHRSLFKGLATQGVRVLDVTDSHLDIVRALATASCVVSSSLHGLIVAQAYGVPWVWMRLEGEPLDRSDFKFHDFFSTLDTEKVPQFTFNKKLIDLKALTSSADAAAHFEYSIDLELLATSLPQP